MPRPDTWMRFARRFAMSAVAVFASGGIPEGHAVTVSVIGPTAITVAPGEVFTLDVGLENEASQPISGIGVYVSGFGAADATVISGRSASFFFTNLCTATTCYGGLPTLENRFYDPNDLPSGAHYNGEVGGSHNGYPTGGESIPVVLALGLPGASGTGAVDPGLDGGLDEPSPRDATIDIIANAIGVHVLTISGLYTVYQVDGVFEIENTATFTVTVRDPGPMSGPVPEPTAALVFGLGLVVVASRLRHRRDAPA